MSESIHFHTEDTSFELAQKDFISNWISSSIKNEGQTPGDLNFIFCSDDYLLEINISYLDHDTYTDVITFNYVEGDFISGDIYISVDRVKENAQALNVRFETELKRVMIHGVLHLLGYKDKTPEEAKEIRAKEDFYLTLRPEN